MDRTSPMFVSTAAFALAFFTWAAASASTKVFLVFASLRATLKTVSAALTLASAAALAVPSSS